MICASHSCASCPLSPVSPQSPSKFINAVHFALFQRGVDRSIEANVLHPFARPSFSCLHFAISAQLSSGMTDGRKEK